MAANAPAKPVTVEMTRGKDTKTKIRYEAEGTDLPFDNIYVDKDLAAQLGDTITVTVEPA